MATPVQRKPSVYSQFYKDLASPLKLDLSSHSHSQNSTPSPLWRHGFGGPDPPPPPTLSLEDQLHSSPIELLTPPADNQFKTPTKQSITPTFSSKVISFRNTSPPDGFGQSSAGPSYSTPWDSNRRSVVLFEGDKELRGDDESGALLALQPPLETAHVDSHVSGTSDGQGWVTVYGFTAQHTNLVLREFEKCGKILKHVPGPEGANWVHILYQNSYDVQKALQKNGVQINVALMVGVKLMDPLQRQIFTEKAKTAFMVLPPRSPGKVAASTTSTKASRPYYLQQPNEGGQRFTGPIASPSKSAISRIVDLIFGI